MEKIVYTCENFEGPLDLLLSLISKNKIDIYNIEIHSLLEQYMEKINQMREYNMEIASEFLEMAARLVRIKSTMLLPKHEEEAMILKQELSGQLIEYKECKRIAGELSKIISFDRFCREAEKVGIDMTYTRIHNIEDLIKAYISAGNREKLKTKPTIQDFSGIVMRKIVSVNTKVVYVLRRLIKQRSMTYINLFYEQNAGKSDVVATFLALLELIKNKRVRINGQGDLAEIELVRED